MKEYKVTSRDISGNTETAVLLEHELKEYYKDLRSYEEEIIGIMSREVSEWEEV